MCSDDFQCNLKGECELDDGQCKCNQDWTASPDCSGTLSYLICTFDVSRWYSRFEQKEQMEGQIDRGRNKQIDERTDADWHGPTRIDTDQHRPTQTDTDQHGPTRTNKRTNGLTDGPMDTQNVRSIPSQLSYVIHKTKNLNEFFLLLFIYLLVYSCIDEGSCNYKGFCQDDGCVCNHGWQASDDCAGMFSI